ncbi:MAG: hypothetical protein NC184_03715 [Roseburia sp.]|nr:hypothetical protein [Roseburia sp.]
MKKRLERAVISVQNVIAVAKAEMVNAHSKWRKDVIENVVLPEMQELYDHFIAGERYFKYKNTVGILTIKQRLLQSTHFLLDTMEDLSSTNLGQAIHDFQKIYKRL